MLMYISSYSSPIAAKKELNCSAIICLSLQSSPFIVIVSGKDFSYFYLKYQTELPMSFSCLAGIAQKYIYIVFSFC